MGTVKLKSSDEVFQLKISLLGSDPEIWRTIQISSAATLSRLHKAIQSAFDWEDSHLHEFTTIKHEKINKRQKLKEVTSSDILLYEGNNQCALSHLS